jgi:hypothetical protein
MPCHCSYGQLFFKFKGAGPFKLKKNVFQHLKTLYCGMASNCGGRHQLCVGGRHNGNHTGSIVPQATTVVVASCGATLPIVFPVLLLSYKPALIGCSMPQNATTTAAACGTMLPVW